MWIKVLKQKTVKKKHLKWKTKKKNCSKFNINKNKNSKLETEECKLLRIKPLSSSDTDVNQSSGEGPYNDSRSSDTERKIWENWHFLRNLLG